MSSPQVTWDEPGPQVKWDTEDYVANRPGMPKPPNAIEQDIRNPRSPRYQGGMPGSFEGHPENVGEWPKASFGEMGGGVKDIVQGNVARGGHRLISGAGNVMLPAAPFLAAANPALFARAVGGGVVGGELAERGSKLLGANPEQAEFAGDVGNVVGGGAAATGPKLLRMGRPALGKTATFLSDVVDPELTGVISPRLAHGQKLLGRLGTRLQTGIPAYDQPVFPGAPLPESPGEFPGAPLPAKPSPELIQGNALREGGRIPPPEQASVLGRIPAQPTYPGAPLPEKPPWMQPKAEAPTPRIPQIAEEAVRGAGGKIPAPPERGKSIYPRAVGGPTVGKGIPQETPPITQTESSALSGYHYDPSSKTMTVEMKSGGMYRYGEVTPEEFAKFEAADSKGKAYADIRNNHVQTGKKVGEKWTVGQPRAVTASPQSEPGTIERIPRPGERKQPD